MFYEAALFDRHWKGCSVSLYNTLTILDYDKKVAYYTDFGCMYGKLFVLHYLQLLIDKSGASSAMRC